MKQKKISVTNILPVCTLLIVVIVFSFVSQGRLLSGRNIASVVDQSLTVMIGGMGILDSRHTSLGRWQDIHCFI